MGKSDVYIPPKRDKMGNRFRFVRFMDVSMQSF